MESLIKLRGPDQFKTRRGRNLFWVTFEHVAVRCIQANEPCPPICWQWLADISPFIGDEDRSALAVYYFLLEASVFIHSVMQARYESPKPADALAAVPQVLERLATVDAVDMPYYLLPRFPTQGYLWNNYRCVRALVYHAVVELLDFASSAVAGEESQHVRAALQGLRSASLEITHDMVQAVLDNLCTDAENDPDTNTHWELNTLCWGDTLKHLWAVSNIAEVSGVGSRQHKQVDRLLARMYRHLGIEGPQEVNLKFKLSSNMDTG
ncbi:hypothetical protein B0H67DRAFT_647939 [Lasiosphaeris hirsuta]|uniref:Uncharacterized protein n=1 Tax=Lasiosphaeris hirsuta TaxID=260670 RepID=A0AA40DNM0_9PEZI|nr:hypothetical protein B0H67DRAFT_647939 [Lasiosphaeris hirsuta]